MVEYTNDEEKKHPWSIKVLPIFLGETFREQNVADTPPNSYGVVTNVDVLKGNRLPKLDYFGITERTPCDCEPASRHDNDDFIIDLSNPYFKAPHRLVGSRLCGACYSNDADMGDKLHKKGQQNNADVWEVLCKGKTSLFLYATRDIKANEHICWAYGLDYWTEHYKGKKSSEWVHNNYSFRDATKLIPNEVKLHADSVDLTDPEHKCCGRAALEKRFLSIEFA
jgi:hypothetical protein